MEPFASLWNVPTTLLIADLEILSGLDPAVKDLQKKRMDGAGIVARDLQSVGLCSDCQTPSQSIVTVGNLSHVIATLRFQSAVVFDRLPFRSIL